MAYGARALWSRRVRSSRRSYAHPRHQLAEPVAVGSEPARHSQIRVDHDDLLGGSPQFDCHIGQTVLTRRRLGVLAHLYHRRLPHITAIRDRCAVVIFTAPFTPTTANLNGVAQQRLHLFATAITASPHQPAATAPHSRLH